MGDTQHSSGKQSGLNKIFRLITIGYLLLIIPGVAVYAGMRWLTDLRGRALFNSFLPVVLLLLILYIYYLVRPFRLLGISAYTSAREEMDDDELDWTAPVEEESTGS